MATAFDDLAALLKQLPGLGYRSAERLAVHLLVEKPERLEALREALGQARASLGRCKVCGNLAEGERCAVCASTSRDDSLLCIVESVADLMAMERAGVFRGRYHVLHGRLSPLKGVGPEELNLATLPQRLDEGEVREVVLALANDVEGQATCHYLAEELLGGRDLTITRIGFGLPSGGGLTYADAGTLENALKGRQSF